MWTRPFIRRTLALAALVLAAGSCDQAHRLTGPSGALRAEAPQADSVAPAAQTVNAWAFKAGTGAVNATLEGVGYYDGGGAAWFEYGADSTLASPFTSPPDSVAGVQRVVHRTHVGPLVRDSIYYFRLVVRTQQGTRMGAVRRFRAGAPDPASSFAVTLDSLDYTLDLTWTHDGANVQTWTVLRRPVGQAAWTKVIQFVSPDRREFTDSVLNPLMGGAYEYQVLACNASYCGASPVLSQQAPPLPPATGLTATPVGTRIELAWQKGPYGGELQVYRRRSASQDFTLLESGVLHHTATAFADHTVTPGQGYVYRVRVCARGCVDSEPASATAVPRPGVAPGPVTELVKMADGTGRVQATLHGTVVTNGADATGWMEYGTDPGPAGAASTPAVPVPASATVQLTPGVSGLVRDQVYYYRVVAQADTIRAEGPIRSFRAGAPDAPASTAAQFDLGAWAVSLTWAHPGDGDPQVFSVERRRAGQAWGQILRVVPAARTAVDAAFTILADHDFEYRISACNRIACSAPGPAAPVHAPGLLPSQVTATQEGTAVRVQWQHDAPGSRTRGLYRRTGADTVTLFAFQEGGITPLSPTGSLLQSNLPPGTHVFFLVLCARGECVTSNEASLTLTSGTNAPVAVTGAETQVQMMTDGSGRVQGWVSGSVDANGLQTETWVQYSLSPTLAGDASGTHVDAGHNTAPINVYSPFSGLLRDTVYYYRVRARNAHGESAGEVKALSTGAPVPATNLTASLVTARSKYVHLQWSHGGARVEHWVVEWRPPGQGWTKFVQLPWNSRELQDYSGPGFHGSTLEYRVSACNEIGCSAPVQVAIHIP